MKKKVLALIILSIVFASILALSSFAFKNGDYAVTFGDLTTNNLFRGTGIYGGIYTQPNTTGFISYDDVFEKSEKYDSVRYQVSLHGVFDGIVVIFYLPYSTNRYISNIQYSPISNDDNFISVEFSEVTLALGNYDMHYNNLGPQTISTNVSAPQKAIRVAVQLRESDYLAKLQIAYQYTDIPNSSSLNQEQTINLLKDFLDDNQSSINTVFYYLSQIWSFGYISILITLSVLLAVIAILFNWGTTL